MPLNHVHQSLALRTQFEQLQKEIEAKGMAVKACVVDFVQPTKDQWQGLVDAVNEGHVSVLGNSSVVNNIGVCHAAPGFFDEEDRALCDDMVRANVVSTMTATRIVVPQMQAQGNGLILNMGSFAALRSLPFMSVYAGTKGFVKTFSQSLAYELEPDGITVSYIYGQWGIGSMLGSKGRSLFNPAPSTFVRSALDRIGLKCGAHDSHTSIPYYPHSIVNFVSSCLWDPMHAKLAHYGFGQHVYALGAEKRTHAAAE
ncbi:hypothetical protein H4R18_002585 [Coemansia javaensis]|uniref:NAD(P)-binding protein n=1 Tax=Coemansia javaensis TaxID=2761396 RepID=A0A9W8HCJ9_9FUNG|nr:hypothetical protein H4R18_002585 [Coemansia javaensis]